MAGFDSVRGVCVREYEMLERRIINNTLFDKLLPFYYPIFPFWQLHARNTHSSLMCKRLNMTFLLLPPMHIVVFVAVVRALRARSAISVLLLFFFYFHCFSIYSVKKACANIRTRAREKKEANIETRMIMLKYGLEMQSTRFLHVLFSQFVCWIPPLPTHVSLHIHPPLVVRRHNSIACYFWVQNAALPGKEYLFRNYRS